MIDEDDADMLKSMHKYDGVADHVLEHGHKWTPIPRPKGLRKRRDKNCFANASRVSNRPEWDFEYCEGFALTEFGWIHHAWCVDDQDHAVDVTWKEPALDYFGVMLDKQTIYRLMVNENRIYGTWLHRQGCGCIFCPRL